MRFDGVNIQNMEINSNITSTEQPNENFYGILDTAHRNQIVRRAFTTPGQSVIAKITFCERPKVVFTNLRGGVHRIFVLGGCTGDHYFNQVYELVNKNRGYHAQIQKASMRTKKISFGCCVDSMNETIYTVGGLQAKGNPIEECTAYNIEENSWEVLPALREACYSTSCIVFNSECLYTIGGINAADKEIKTFQRLNLNELTAWEVLQIKLPTAQCNIGLH